MKDIEISYVIVARDMDYIKIDGRDEERFSIIDPLVSITTRELPTSFRCRLAFSSTGLKYGTEYEPFIYVKNPDGDIVFEVKSRITHTENSTTAITFVQDVHFDFSAYGEYKFTVGFTDIIAKEYVIYTHQGEPSDE